MGYVAVSLEIFVSRHNLARVSLLGSQISGPFFGPFQKKIKREKFKKRKLIKNKLILFFVYRRDKF